MPIEQLTDEERVTAVERYEARDRKLKAALDMVLAERDGRWPGMRQDRPRRIDDEGDVHPVVTGRGRSAPAVNSPRGELAPGRVE